MRAGIVLAGLGLLAGCDRSDLETDRCERTRLVVQDVDASRANQLFLSATLVTESGEPVPDRRVDFGLARSADRTDQFFAGTTDAAGVAWVDVLSQARSLEQVDEAVRTATLLKVSYRNPDAFNDAAQPNYCSSETVVAFRYTGPPDYSPGPA